MRIGEAELKLRATVAMIVKACLDPWFWWVRGQRIQRARGVVTPPFQAAIMAGDGNLLDTAIRGTMEEAGIDLQGK